MTSGSTEDTTVVEDLIIIIKLYKQNVWEETTKWMIRRRKSKDRQYND